MSFIRAYARLIALLAPEARLAGILALANIALAVAQLVEPVLFGQSSTRCRVRCPPRSARPR